MNLEETHRVSVANNVDSPDGALLATSSEGYDERRYFQWMRKATEIRPLQRMYSWVQRRNEPQYNDLITVRLVLTSEASILLERIKNQNKKKKKLTSFKACNL